MRGKMAKLRVEEDGILLHRHETHRHNQHGRQMAFYATARPANDAASWSCPSLLPRLHPWPHNAPASFNLVRIRSSSTCWRNQTALQHKTFLPLSPARSPCNTPSQPDARSLGATSESPSPASVVTATVASLAQADAVLLVSLPLSSVPGTIVQISLDHQCLPGTLPVGARRVIVSKPGLTRTPMRKS